MPQLPVYDTPKIQSQGAPGGMLNVQAPNPGAAIGQGLSNLGRDMSEVQFRADNAVSENTLYKYLEFQNTTLGNLGQVHGEAALKPDPNTGLTPDQAAMQALKDKQDELSKDLSGGAQRLFTAKVMPHYTQFEAQAQAHLNHETDVFHMDTVIGTSKVSAQAAALDPSTEIVNSTNVQTTETAAALEAERQGKTGDAKTAFVTQLTSPVVSATVTAALQKGLAPTAQAYLEKNKNLVTAQDYERLTSVTKTGNDNLAALAAADDVVKQTTNPDGSIRIADANSILTDRVRSGGLTPEQKTLAEAELKDRVNLHSAQTEQQVSTNSDASFGIWNKTHSIGSVTTSQPYLSMPQKMQASMLDYMKREQIERAVPTDPATISAQRVAYWKLMTDPNVLSLTDSQVRAKQGELGLQNTLKAMNEINHMRATPAKVAQTHVDSDLLLTSLQQAGVIKNTAKLSPDEDTAVASIRSQLKEAQQASGQEWSLDNTKKLIALLVQKVVTDKHWYGDDTKRVFELRSSGATIPAQFAADMETKAKAQFLQSGGKAQDYRGLDPTLLYQLYYNARQQGIIDANGNYKPKLSLTTTPSLPTSAQRGH